MRDQLLTPLHNIESAIREILDSTDLNFSHEQLLESVQRVTHDLTELVISVPDLTWDKARELLSFEARSELASIIGYAELLLDDGPAAFNQQQMQCIHTIRAQGKSLLSRLMQLEKDTND